jgi:hypothetical protein
MMGRLSGFKYPEIAVDYGTSTVISGVFTTLSTMAEAHSYYIQCHLFSYNFPLE